MAIDYSQFIYSNSDKEGKDLIKGLKSNKNFDQLMYRFSINGSRHRKLINLTSATNLNKSARIKRANSEATLYRDQKEDELNDGSMFTFDTKFKELAKEYVSNKCATGTKWTAEKETMLDHYIYPHLKGMKASSIREMHIDKIRVSMQTKGYSKQNKDGCSNRTIRKVLLQVLKPILEYGHRNGAIKRISEITVPSRPKKKTVKDGSEKLVLLYTTIHTLYKEDHFYRALFLFAFFGRRWNEIRTLQWSDIDFDKAEYTIRAENSKIDEDKTFTLPADIIEALSHFSNESGLVFESPRTGLELTLPKKQIEKLRKASAIDELTLHYFRHIMATALSDSGMVGTVLSASLGHNNSQTVDNYYRTANHLKASSEATKSIEHIVEVSK